MHTQTIVSASRRQAARKAEMIAADATAADWIQMIRSEYLEMPGLHLTRTQVRRLWSLDPATCDALLDALVGMNFLRLTDTGAYVRADTGVR